MAVDVLVPSSLLGDIFRLLEYLDKRTDHDAMHFHSAGYSSGFEHDNALWELKLKIKRLQKHIVETYLLTVDGVTDVERLALRNWVAGGNCVYDNPFSLYNDSGLEMDFINGCRMAHEMALNPSAFFGPDVDAVDCGGWDYGQSILEDDELPF